MTSTSLARAVAMPCVPSANLMLPSQRVATRILPPSRVMATASPLVCVRVHAREYAMFLGSVIHVRCMHLSASGWAYFSA
jgi:hypothetical protein